MKHRFRWHPSHWQHSITSHLERIVMMCIKISDKLTLSIATDFNQDTLSRYSVNHGLLHDTHPRYFNHDTEYGGWVSWLSIV
jgi:hypothetical protein